MPFRKSVFSRFVPIGLLALSVGACAFEASRETSLVDDGRATNEAEIARYERLRQENPDDLQALIGSSRSLRHAGRGKEALEVLENAEPSFASNPGYLTELGKAHLLAGEINASRVALTNAVNLDERNWQALAALGVTNDLDRAYVRARSAYNRALNLCPNSAAILNNLAISHSYSGDFDSSMELFERALDVQPTSLRIHRNMLALQNLRSRCPQCSREQNARLASAIYPQDWLNTEGEISCGNNVLMADKITTELEENDFIDMRVLFSFDSAKLTPEAHEALDELASAISSNTLAGYRFHFEGHTDAQGPDEYNLDLSERRAASVKSYLIEAHGIDAARLEGFGFGEARLAAPDDPMSGLNRRVRVVKIVRAQEMPVARL